MATVGGMPSAEDEAPAVREAVRLRDVPTEDLLKKADAGSRAACAELDRRGVEPPSVDVGPPPVPSY